MILKDLTDKSKISVPLHKVHSWRIRCNCGGHVDIGSGGISGVERATCPSCKNDLPLDDILPVMKAAKQLCCNNGDSNLSLLIMLDRCEVA